MPLFKRQGAETRRKKKEKEIDTDLILTWKIRTNFTSAMYTHHIFQSEGASCFLSEDKNELEKMLRNCKECGKKDKAAEYSLMRITPF